MSDYSLPNPSLASSADMHFLEKLDDEQFWRYAIQLAGSSRSSVLPLEGFLTCMLEQSQCALSMRSLREVLPTPAADHISLLPASPPWMAGLIPWHYDVIAVVDFMAYLTHTRALLRSSDLLLIAQVEQKEEQLVGLLMPISGDVKSFDAASPLLAIHSSDLLPPLLPAAALQGVREDFFILDLPYVLADIVRHIQMATSYV